MLLMLHVAVMDDVIYEVTFVFVFAGETAISSYPPSCNKNRLSANSREWCRYVSYWTVKGIVEYACAVHVYTFCIGTQGS